MAVASGNIDITMRPAWPIGRENRAGSTSVTRETGVTDSMWTVSDLVGMIEG
jgi:hypothetical protein